MKPKRLMKQLVFGAGLFLLSLSLLQTPSFASLVSVSLTGEIALDEGFATGNVTGSFSTIESGGPPTTKTFNGATVSGDNPIVGSFSSAGDGFNLSGTANTTSGEFSTAIDFMFNLENNSPTDTYEIDLRVHLISHSVNADGPDAYATSEFVVEDSSSEFFVSYLVSDTFYGDEFGDENDVTFPNTFGGPQSDTDDATFTITLLPGTTEFIEGFWQLEGGDFDTGLAEADFDAAITIADITNLTVPVPGTLGLLGAGLFMIAGWRRKGEQPC